MSCYDVVEFVNYFSTKIKDYELNDLFDIACSEFGIIFYFCYFLLKYRGFNK